MRSDHAAKLAQILSGYLSNPILPIPVRVELKKRLQLDDKKAKSSLVWLIKLDIPSSFFHVSRKFMNRRGYFICKDPKSLGVNLAEQMGVNLPQRYSFRL